MKSGSPALLVLAILPGLLLAACSPGVKPDPLFDEVMRGEERKAIDAEIAAKGDLGLAIRGDRAAVSRVLQAAKVKFPVGSEERRETINRIVTVMMHLGDKRFASILAEEDKATREAAGEAIDWLFFSRSMPYPETRACYEYRFYFPPEQD